MKIFGFDVNNYVLNTTKKIEIDQVYNHDLEKWIDIFCMSFDSLGIKDEVTSIISKHYRSLTLLVAHFNLDHGTYPVGCCLLFEKNNNIGLYCLGTVRDFRNKGVARQLIGNAIKIAKDNDYNTLVLQSLTEEKYDEFYKKLGFRTIYKKELFTFNLI